MNAFMLLLVAIGLAGVGLAIHLVLRKRRQATQKSSNKVDHAHLAANKFLQYVSWLKENIRGHDAQIDEIANSIQEERRDHGVTPFDSKRYFHFTSLK